MGECPFEILGLPFSASKEEIDRRWKDLMLKSHPDKIGAAEGTERAKVLNDARVRATETNEEIEKRNETLRQYRQGDMFYCAAELFAFEGRKCMYNNACDRTALDEKLSKCPPEDRQGAEALFQYGMRGLDTTGRVLASETARADEAEQKAKYMEERLVKAETTQIKK